MNYLTHRLAARQMAAAKGRYAASLTDWAIFASSEPQFELLLVCALMWVRWAARDVAEVMAE